MAWVRSSFFILVKYRLLFLLIQVKIKNLSLEIIGKIAGKHFTEEAAFMTLSEWSVS